MFGSLGSRGKHCLDLPTYLSSIGSLATCLVRSKNLLFGRLATCLDHLDRSLPWEKNANPHVSYCLSFLVFEKLLVH